MSASYLSASHVSQSMGGSFHGDPSASHIPEHLLSEVRLCTNAEEREQFDNLATVFALIQTLEHLEKQYTSDVVPAAEYADACNRLLAQYKTKQASLPEAVRTNIEQFMKDYRLQCPAALHRIKIGVDATVEFRPVSAAAHGSGLNAAKVAATAQNFITLMDALQIGLKSRQELQGPLEELLHNLGKMALLPDDFSGKLAIKKWLETFSPMSSFEELSPDQIKDLHFDLETSYGAYLRWLEDK